MPAKNLGPGCLFARGKIAHMKRTRLVLASFFSVALLLHVHPLLAATEYDTGWFQETCSGAEFKITRVHQTPGKLAIFFITNLPTPSSWQFMVGPEWLPVHGMLCASETKCENASEAKIHFELNKNHTRANGQYSLDVNGRHLQGNFVLKYKARHDVQICE